MHRKRKRYRIIRRRDGEVWDFDTAKAAALHMWGRDVKEYMIYKEGTRLRSVPSNLTELERQLDALQSKPCEVER